MDAAVDLHDGDPSGGGRRLATWEDLHAELALTRYEIVSTVHELGDGLRAELRTQTRWLAAVLFATVILNAAIISTLSPA